MKVLKVLNVGQGDSIILNSDKTCIYKNKKIFIDLGSGNYDVTRHIESSEKVNIFLTHHHSDHLGGLKYFIDGKFKQIEKIIVPFYQNEITLIAQAILHLKGINRSIDCGEFINQLNDIINNQKFLVQISNKTIFSFAYEGKHFCDHIECLNPPFLIKTYDWLNECDEKEILDFMDELFDKNFARDIKIYIHALRSGNKNIDTKSIYSLLLYDYDEGNNNNNNYIMKEKGNFVINFLMTNVNLFRDFNSDPSRNNLRKIYNKYEKCTHDICIVLKVFYKGKVFLLTSDASKNVFNRLILEGKNIMADYIKMPHHGSKHNINNRILNYICPKVAIISHNNGHFGKAKDTHPNIEVLSMLQKRGIKILITNDVVKNGITTMKKSKHSTDNYVEI